MLVQDTEMLVLPNPILQYNTTYVVTLPAFSIRYMTLDFAFSFTTRLADLVSPFIRFAYPSGPMTPLSLHGFQWSPKGATKKAPGFLEGGTAF